MGLNTISIYIMWAGFEKEDGSFDFETGSNNLRRFFEICREEKIWVLMRPGPYVCAEWDFGGVPNRLLKDPKAKIRTLSDKNYVAGATAYLKRVAEIAKPFRAEKGGPIIMVALENEFGSWIRRHERNYLEWLRDFWKGNGFHALCTCDGPSDGYLTGVTLPGVAVGLDPGENEGHFAAGRKHAKGAPVFCSEFYPGWIRHWREGNWTPVDKTATVDWFMKNGHSFGMYMLTGGTSFGFTQGANNFNKSGYEPDVTSYDFGCPLDEQGRVTQAFHNLRAVIAKNLPEGTVLPTIEADIPAMEIPEFTPVRVAGLWDRVPAKPRLTSEKPAYFESFDQNQGMAVYTATVPAGPEEKLEWTELHDYGHFYLDGEYIGTYDRSLQLPAPLVLPARAAPAKLEILVESMGHICYTTGSHPIGMEQDRKGLFGVVKFAGKPLTGWSVRPLPLKPADIVGKPPVTAASTRRGSHFRATVTLKDAPKDTFLDMSKYDKGVVWVNGHNLGRYWSVGPQLRLYCPASWLKQGENTIDVLDLEMTEPRPLRGCHERNFGPINMETKNLNNAW